MKRRDMLGAALVGATALIVPASAQTTRASKKVPELVLGDDKGDDFAVSQKDFELISPQGYRWQITSKSSKELAFMAPDFFRNVWMNQIVVEDLEVHMAGAPDHLEFDEPGTFLLEFATVRPGEYEWWIQGLKAKGMAGKIVIK
jgi:hypothetical protein